MQSPSLSDWGLPSSFGRQKSKKKNASSFAVDEGINDLVDECFSKSFEFQPGKWILPDATSLFKADPWQLDRFQSLKTELNNVKDLLNDFPLNEWHCHTKSRNYAGHVIWQVKQKINPELLTQAWCKFYEIISSFPLIVDKAIHQKKLNSVHLCEAPGAFITSLNHHLRSLYGNDFLWEWQATTLNPYFEGNSLSSMIDDDRFILETHDSWTFGEDYTGDLMTKSNLEQLLKDFSCMGEILLVTADGSIDCQDNPKEQESCVSRLHLCETVTALNILSPGGSFLIKIFTIFESSSICLLYLLNCVFKAVYIKKPVCSKPGNSEVYVICCEYRGKEVCSSWLTALNEVYGDSSHPLFALNHIPSDFINQLYTCSEKFTRYQVKVIEENIHTFKFPSRHAKYVSARLRHEIAEQFLIRLKLVKLPSDLCLVGTTSLKSTKASNISPSVENGSYNDRQRRIMLNPVEELACLRDDLNHLHENLNHIDTCSPSAMKVCWVNFPVTFEGFRIIRGKAISEINSSKFCCGRLLLILNRVKCIARNNFKLNISTKYSERKEEDISCGASVHGVTSLDFINAFWNSLDGGCYKQSHVACRRILSAVYGMRCHESLQVHGFPMLTQLNAGLIFLLAHLFQKVGFSHHPGQFNTILFSDFRQWNPSMKSYWEELREATEEGTGSIVSIVSILLLSGGDFYKYVTEINNSCVLEAVDQLINEMSARANELSVENQDPSCIASEDVQKCASF